MRIKRWVDPPYLMKLECMACGEVHTIEKCKLNYRCKYDGNKTHQIREKCSHPICKQPKAKLNEYLEYIRAYSTDQWWRLSK
jgi:hypothetical protein